MIKSKPKKSSVLILTIGGPLSILFGTFLIIKGNGNLGVLILGIPFILLGIYSLYWMYNFDILIISNGNLIFKSITGFTKKTIPLTEFDSYSEIEKENAKLKHEVGYMKWKDLTLISEDFNYKISSTSYSNYEELRKELIFGLKRNTKFEHKWHSKNSKQFGIFFILFGILFGTWFLRISENSLNEILIIISVSLAFIGVGIYLIKTRKNASR
jgi:hypothetical protein